MSAFFTSDTHFGHKNVIPYCDRPWKTIEEMRLSLIVRWNNQVSNEDVVYHLGDFALMGFDDARDILNHLTGFKILIRGNHDKSLWTMSRMGWDLVCDSAYFEDVYLAHVPLPKIPKGKKMFCGHVHKKWKRRGNIFNVGVDVWNYEPVPFGDVLAAKPTPGPSAPDQEDVVAWREGRGIS